MGKRYLGEYLYLLRKENNKGITILHSNEEEEYITYSEFYKLCNEFGEKLKAVGISTSDKVLIQVNNQKKFIVIMWACILKGIAFIPVKAIESNIDRNLVENIVGQLDDIKIIVEEDNKNKYKQFLEDSLINFEEIDKVEIDNNEIENDGVISDNSMALIQFSSGSTGNPKGIVISHKNIIVDLVSVIKSYKLQEEDSIMTWMPLTHSFGLLAVHILAVMNCTSQYIMQTNTFISKPNLWLRKTSENRSSYLFAPNFAMQYIVDNIEELKEENLDLSCVKSIVSAAENIKEVTCNNFINTLKQFNLKANVIRPAYGLSEGTIFISVTDLAKGHVKHIVDRKCLTIGSKLKFLDSNSNEAVTFIEDGKVLDCCEVRICDDKMNVLPEGYIGRVQIKGHMLAEGYINNNSIEPLYLVDNEWFDTGDIGFLNDNALTITGRSKEIIIINGTNLYPFDFENLIEENTNIKHNSTVVAALYNEEIGEDEILVFTVYEEELGDFTDLVKEIRKVVKKNTGFNIKDVIKIDSVPRNNNGKVRRLELVQNYADGIYKKENLSNNKTNVDKESSVNKINSILIDVIRKELKNNSIDITDSILEYNISSIKIIKILGILANETKVKIEFSEFIDCDTFLELANIINEKYSTNEVVEADKKIVIDKENLYEEFNLTNIQMAYLMGRNKQFELGDTSTHYYAEIETTLDIDKLNKSLNDVVKRQPMLRAIFTNNAKQKILESVPEYKIEVIDAVNKEDILMAERNKMSHHMFDPYTWPLFDFKALKISEEKYRLLFGIDLLVSDGASIQMLFKEIADVYYGKDKEELDITFRDYICSKEGLCETEAYKVDKEFWNNKIPDIPQAPQLPLKVRLADIKKPHFLRKEAIIEYEDWNKLNDLCKKHNTRLTFMLLTAYSLVLSRWSNQKDISLNTTIFNRELANESIHKIIGDFTSALILDVDTKDRNDFWKLAKEVQDNFMNLYSHKNYDGVNVIRDYSTYNNLDNKSAIMPIVFTSMLFDEEDSNFGNIGEMVYGITQTSQVYLDHQVMNLEKGILLNWDYVSEAFEEDTINSMFKEYVDLIMNLSNDININEATYEVEKMFDKYNDTSEEFSTETLQEMFRKQVLLNPENIALKYKEKEVSYKELDIASNKVANYLSKENVQKGDLVGVLAERSIESIISILGILKAGAGYIPINPDFPDERQKYILDNANSNILLNSELCKNIIKNYEEKTDNIYDNVDDIAYIIYTSGSTGKPKGVVIKHKAVCNTIKDINNRFHVDKDDVFIGLASLSFDLSVYDIFGSLTTGGKLIIIDDQRNVEDVSNIVKNEKVTIWNSVPAVMEMLIDYRESHEEQVIDYDDLDELRLVLLSGDWIPVSLPERIKDEFMDCQVISLGGATEASIWSIYYPIEEVDENLTSIPYGYPLANQTYYVLNYNMELCPVGVKGELYIGGVGLAECYLNDDEKTNNSFIIHPKYGRIYKTGDMGRFTNNGYIEFMGRNDSQVKVRGYRIELGEIEAAILENTSIKNAVILNGKDKNGISTLFAFFTSESAVDIQSLRNTLKESLPKYMVPTYLKQVDEIPLTNNGKIDRKTLLSMDLEESGYKKVIIQPKNVVEARLVELWKELLGIKEVSTDDNFFELGGNSILVIKLVSLIEKEFNIKIDFKNFIENSKIKQMAKIIDNSEKKSDDDITFKEIILDVENQYEEFDLTNIQIAYLIGRDKQFELGGTSTHAYMEIETTLEIEKLNDALRKVIQRHPMLRAIILPNGKQKVLENVPDYNIEVIDLTNKTVEEKEDCNLKLRHEMSHHIFDTDVWPLFNFKALKMDVSTYKILFEIDLLIADGASIQMIFKEMKEFYDGKEKKELGITFKDYMCNYKSVLESKKYKEDKEYWQNKLPEIPKAAQLPLKKKVSEVDEPNFGRKLRIIENSTWANICEKAAQNSITPAMILFTAYAKVLSRWSNQDKLSINTTVFNRLPIHEDVNDVIGDFTSLMLLGVDTSVEDDFWLLCKSIQREFMEALDHRDYDGINVIRDYCSYNELDKNSVAMPIVFTSMLFGKTLDLSNSISSIGDTLMSVTQTSQVYLDYQIMEVKDGIQLSWDYIKELFDEDVITNMFNYYIDLILSLVGDKPGIVEDAYLDKFIEDYNNTDEDVKVETLQKLFMNKAKEYPNNIAVKLGDNSFTYKELDERSNKIANYLMENQVGRNDYIGIYAKRDINTIANILGVLKTGAAYVPIEPEYPDERREYILSNSNCKFMLVPDFYDDNDIDEYSQEFLGVDDNKEDVAYIIYTSGSTGKPKGVVIKHESAANTIIDMNNKYNVTSEDRVIALSSMGFDLSIYDIFGSLSSGATLVMIKDHRDIINLIDIVTKEKITIWNSVPAIINMFIDNVDSGYINEDLKHILLSGDWIGLKLPNRIKECFVNADVTSLGGATEGSIWSIYYPINEMKSKWKSIPYGMPLANQKIYILDYQMKHCPIDVEGEIFIGGIGVANGYINEEEKTKAAFINHPTLGYIYKTGDYGVLRKEGYVEFIGRKDYQIKIRGYRIELGEIEKRILEYKNIKTTVVVDKVDSRNNKYLCAYIVSDNQINISEISDYLIEVLPEYMVPRIVMQIDEIPLTQNGKVNLKALPEPEMLEEVASDNYIEASGEIEEKLLETWKEVFDSENIGVADRFFTLGGDSIKAIQICAKVKKYGFKLNVHDILLNQSINKIKNCITLTELKCDQGVVTGKSKLTPVQKWFFEHEFKNMNQWNQGYMLFRKEGFDVAILEKTLDKLVEHHDALRSNFRMNENVLVEYFEDVDNKSYNLSVLDLRTDDNFKDTINTEVEAVQKSLDIENGPMVGAKIFSTIEGDYLFMTIHHLVVDGISWRIILEDLNSIYMQLLEGEEVILPEKSSSFKQWSEALYSYAESNKILEMAEYWSRFNSETEFVLPKDNNFDTNMMKDSSTEIMSISKEDTDRLLQGTSKNIDADINEILLTALAISIKNCYDKSRFIINIEGHGRENIVNNIDISRTVGWFTSISPLLLDITNSTNIEESIEEVKKEVRAIPNKGVDYGILRYIASDEIRNNINLNINPEVTFNYLGQMGQQREDDAFKVLPDYIENCMNEESERASFLDVFGVTVDGSLTFRFIYNSKACNKETMELLSENFKKAIFDIIDYCESQESSNNSVDLLENDISEDEFDDILDILNE
ncbi:MAG: amino acid adenylation domain-containing protein [Clostridium sp.]|nr:amino acid adenylation domain-containing protein [Clostridium sp.]